MKNLIKTIKYRIKLIKMKIILKKIKRGIELCK